MKKLVSLLGIIAILLTMSVSVFAGDIISPLAVQDDAQVYFGEVKDITNDTITVIQKKNVKGEFEYNKEYTYEKIDINSHKDISVGEIYLFTLTEVRERPIIWKTSSTETKTLKILNEHTFAYDMEKALNDGYFEKYEQKRLKKINKAETSSMSVIGGADEPTDIVVKSNINVWLIVGIGALVLLLIIVFIFRKNKR